MKKKILSIALLLGILAANMFAGPLHLAAINGYLEVVEFLVKNGAKVNEKDKWTKNTPLHLAAKYRYLKVTKFLVKNEAKVNEKNKWGNTPLHEATGHLEVVKFLVKKGAEVNAKSNNGSTPLHLAAVNGYLEVVKFLVKNGAKVNAKNSHNSSTPLHLAAVNGHLEVVKFLVLNCAIVEQEGIDDANYLKAVLQYNNLKNETPQEKIKFIKNNLKNPHIFNFLIKLASLRSLIKIIIEIYENKNYKNFTPHGKLNLFFKEESWKKTVFYEFYKDKTINLQNILGVPRQDNYADFVKQVIKKNNFYFAKKFLERKKRHSLFREKLGMLGNMAKIGNQTTEIFF
ncbi:ankyrin repeat domain-containing protein [Candidatus Dependentiae bacterium]